MNNPKRRKLTPAERRAVYNKTDGHCAYCGRKIILAQTQVDHVVPLHLGGADTIENMLPACRSCNHYKGTLSLDRFRRCLENMPDVLDRDSVTYRIARRFGLVVSNPHPVKFYFERQRKEN